MISGTRAPSPCIRCFSSFEEEFSSLGPKVHKCRYWVPESLILGNNCSVCTCDVNKKSKGKMGVLFSLLLAFCIMFIEMSLQDQFF